MRPPALGIHADWPDASVVQEFGGADLGSEGIENFMAHHRCGTGDPRAGRKENRGTEVG